MSNDQSGGILRRELERAIRSGRCVYCRRPAGPDEPLTHEHVIPRARGGTRRDASIIVPACARCNQRRGCSELVRFLLLRPSRISAFLDYLSTLSPDGLRQLDDRVLAELYAAVWLLSESRRAGDDWREKLKRLCAGRALHRRRYAARRVVGAVGDRLQSLRKRADGRRTGDPRSPDAVEARGIRSPVAAEASQVESFQAQLVALLALAWQVSDALVREELERQRELVLRGQAGTAAREGELEEGLRRPRRRRMRVDRRHGRPPRRRGKRHVNRRGSR